MQASRISPGERSGLAQDRARKSPAVQPFIMTEELINNDDDDDNDDENNDLIPPPPPDNRDVVEQPPDAASPRAESEEAGFTDDNCDFEDDDDDDDKEGSGFQAAGTPAAPSERDEEEHERSLEKKRRLKVSLEEGVRRKGKRSQANPKARLLLRANPKRQNRKRRLGLSRPKAFKQEIGCLTKFLWMPTNIRQTTNNCDDLPELDARHLRTGKASESFTGQTTTQKSWDSCRFQFLFFKPNQLPTRRLNDLPSDRGMNVMKNRNQRRMFLRLIAQNCERSTSTLTARSLSFGMTTLTMAET